MKNSKRFDRGGNRRQGQRRVGRFETLEARQLLAAEIAAGESVFPDGLGHPDPEVRALIQAITTTNSQIPIYPASEAGTLPNSGGTSPNTGQSSGLIALDTFRADSRFAGIDGSGFSAVILDTGIDVNHPFFGPDGDSNGIADRIVYQEDFADNDLDASDFNGHGSNVSSIVASEDGTHTGMAPAADIIHLKVFTNAGGGNFGMVEDALQWVVANAATFNIASVNMSLGDTLNHATPQTLYGINDELAALVALDVIVVSSSGNSFFDFSSNQGVGYPAADPNSISVGAVFDSNIGGPINYGGGAVANTTGAGRVTPFSQRSATLTDIVAPGAAITGANHNGGTTSMHGTSQAAPHIAGIAVLAQELAQQELGRRLTQAEFVGLLQTSAVLVNDGDDEDDNVTNTGLDFPLVNVFNLGEAILALGGGGGGGGDPTAAAVAQDITALSSAAQVITVTLTDNSAIDVSDLDSSDVRVTGPNGYDEAATFVNVDNNTDGTPRIATYTIPAPNGLWDFAASGTYTIAMQANQVSDDEENFVAAGTIGTFEVDVPESLGPDAFNYAAFSVAYDFIDISSTGTLVLEGIDDNAIEVASGTGFSFDFYEATFDSVFVSSNGLITFGASDVSFNNSNLTAQPALPTFAVLWDDLLAPGSGLGVYWEVQGSGDSQKLILQWETAYIDNLGDLISFQAILDEADMSLTAMYRDLTGGIPSTNDAAGATVGIKDGGTQSGTELSRRLLASLDGSGTQYVANGLGLQFVRVSSQPIDIQLSDDVVFENQAGGAFVGTFTTLDADLNDTFTYTLVTGTGDDDNASFEILGDQLSSTEAFDFETKSSYSIRVRSTDSGGEFIEEVFVIQVGDYAEIDQIVIGDGTAQRSRVDQVVVEFDGEVTIDEGAFTVNQRGANAGPVTVTVNSVLDGQGRTISTLSFSGGFTRANGALIDGNYELLIDATKITRNGLQLDGDQNGTEGGDYEIGSEETDNFFAMYGDTNGDRNIGFADFVAFRNAFGANLGDPAYSRLFDFEDDGAIGFNDFIQFRNRFGTTLGFE